MEKLARELVSSMVMAQNLSNLQNSSSSSEDNANEESGDLYSDKISQESL